jgi:ubiquinone/menaquinone biosynthesis C-methylase UbiE
MNSKSDVCGVEHVKLLDNGFRRLVHNPIRLFGPYIHPGDTVLDIGCGPGAFTPGLAKLVGTQGKVIAIDLQKEMLELAKGKAQSAGVLDRIQFHQCNSDSLNISVQAHFALTFYMVHEAPDPMHLIDQVCTLLTQGGYYYLSEPKFHVSENQYRDVVARCVSNGLTVVKEGGLFSRTAVFQKRG